MNNVDESHAEEREISMEKLDPHTIAVLGTPPVPVEVLLTKKKKKTLIEVDTSVS